MKKELRIGLITEVMYIVLSRFFSVPDLFLGLLEGFAICFILIGILPQKANSKLKDWKSALVS